MRALVIASLSIGVLIAAPQPASAAPPPWYPAMRWVPAADENFEAGRAGTAISRIVIHATEGRYAGTLSWFQNARSGLSAHYVIRASDGLITQMVAEKDTAFHARGSNRGTIGIEHEWYPASGVRFTDAQYRSSAALVCAIARRYGIAPDRAHIVGHSELDGSDHTDPGASWAWAYYMRLVNECSGPEGLAAAVPDPDLSSGERGAQVALLQWQLAYLGFLSEAAVISGGGNFGPQTLAAVRAFQRLNALPTTGLYGPLTADALARALARAPSKAALPGLAVGAQSDGVAQLQRDLGRLGYMSVVTGYFGPVTAAAVARFQSDRGIDATGTYGQLTRAAMLRHAR